MARDIGTYTAHDIGTRLWRALGFINNLLLIPLFTVMVLETGLGLADERYAAYSAVNLGFCVFFLAEWALGLAVSLDRRAYLRSPALGLDLVSSIPFGYLFQGLRIVRLFRIARIGRLMLRARRFRGRGAALIRAAGIVSATVFAGAVALRIVEPETCPRFGDALWWSLVTLSTVGYGDILPVTAAGKAVASVLIIFGIGVFGYVAGFMATLLDDPEEDQILATVQRIEARLARLEASGALATDRADPDRAVAHSEP